MSYGICGLLWLQGLLTELGVSTKDPMNLYCDNKAVINTRHNPLQRDSMKYIEDNRHFIKEQLQSRKICTPFAKTGDQ